MMTDETYRTAIKAFFEQIGGKDFVEQIQASDEQIQRYRKQITKQPAPQWITPGKVLQMEHTPQGAQFTCENAKVLVTFFADDCIRVRVVHPSETFNPVFSYAVVKESPNPVDLEIITENDAYILRSAALVCRVQIAPYRLEVHKCDGTPVVIEADGPALDMHGRVKLSTQLEDDEASYGTGERVDRLNLRGRKLRFWNTDPAIYERGSDPIYYNVPFYLGLNQYGAYGIFWDNSHDGTIDIGQTDDSLLTWESVGGELRYFIFSGDIKGILERYTELTGRHELLPIWGLGYHQSRYSYYPQEDVLQVAEWLREREIPCDALYLDIHYMDGYRVFTWDKRGFPEPAALLQKLHEMGFKVVVILDPGIKVDPQYEAYISGVEADVFCKFADGTPVLGAVWPGACHWPDFTNPKTRAWWAEQCKAFLSSGVDGIWNDMCEPVTFSIQGASDLPVNIQHDKEGLGSNHAECRNVYGMQMGRASQEGLRNAYPERRPFNIIRAGYAGAQRHAISWTGDNRASWEQLRLGIAMTLNMGLSGAAFTGPDIGGFGGDTTAELLTRWTQAGCLLPFFRNHSAVDTIRQEPWAFGQPYEDIIRAAIELRYRLLPYLYTAAAECTFYGWPVVRPLAMYEPDNPMLRDIDDCYMLGDHVLVAPIVEKAATAREVYLPRGEWYDFWTGEKWQGGHRIVIDAPLDKLPLFIRVGTALPMWPVMQFADAQGVDTLSIRLYVGNGETRIYEDAGEGLGYLQGDYRWVQFQCTETGKHFKVKKGVIGDFRPSYKQIRLEVVGLNTETTWFIDGEEVEAVKHAGMFTTITVDDFERLEIPLRR